MESWDDLINLFEKTPISDDNEKQQRAVEPEVLLKLSIDYQLWLPLFGTTSLVVRSGVQSIIPEILSLDTNNLPNMPGFQLLVEEKFLINYDNAKKIRK